MHKSIYINSKSTVQNTADYSGQEKLFGKCTYTRTVRALPADRPRHQGEPWTGTLQKQCLHYGLSDGEASIALDQARTVRPQARTVQPQAWTVRPVKNQKNPKVTGSVKCIFSVLADRPGCTTGPSTTALSNI